MLSRLSKRDQNAPRSEIKNEAPKVYPGSGWMVGGVRRDSGHHECHEGWLPSTCNRVGEKKIDASWQDKLTIWWEMADARRMEPENGSH